MNTDIVGTEALDAIILIVLFYILIRIIKAWVNHEVTNAVVIHEDDDDF